MEILGAWVGDKSGVSDADPKGPDANRPDADDGHPTRPIASADARKRTPTDRAYSQTRSRGCHYDGPHPGSADRFVEHSDGMCRTIGSWRHMEILGAWVGDESWVSDADPEGPDAN